MSNFYIGRSQLQRNL